MYGHSNDFVLKYFSFLHPTGQVVSVSELDHAVQQQRSRFVHEQVRYVLLSHSKNILQFAAVILWDRRKHFTAWHIKIFLCLGYHDLCIF